MLNSSYNGRTPTAGWGDSAPHTRTSQTSFDKTPFAKFVDGGWLAQYRQSVNGPQVRIVRRITEPTMSQYREDRPTPAGSPGSGRPGGRTASPSPLSSHAPAILSRSRRQNRPYCWTVHAPTLFTKHIDPARRCAAAATQFPRAVSGFGARSTGNEHDTWPLSPAPPNRAPAVRGARPRRAPPHRRTR